jgi:hypothetical protein
MLPDLGRYQKCDFEITYSWNAILDSRNMLGFEIMLGIWHSLSDAGELDARWRKMWDLHVAWGSSGRFKLAMCIAFRDDPLGSRTNIPGHALCLL